MLLLVATAVSTAPKPMVTGAALVVVAGGFWVTNNPPFSPRYATVAADFHLTGGRISAAAGSVPPGATRYLVPGTKSADGRCASSFNSKMIGGSPSGTRTAQIESSQETCESVVAVWRVEGSPFGGGSGGWDALREKIATLSTPTPAP
ncbi:MAG: hypothetical protein EXR52_08635 [Dehalococcoidia bacterium]|nr:hypothetical protein [Dehalococcoidia bacterium]